MWLFLVSKWNFFIREKPTGLNHARDCGCVTWCGGRLAVNGKYPRLYEMQIYRQANKANAGGKSLKFAPLIVRNKAVRFTNDFRNICFAHLQSIINQECNKFVESFE